MNLNRFGQLRILVAGYALSTVGDAGVRMVLAWITLERLGAEAMSQVFIGSAAACLFGPLVGRGLDRWPPRVLLGASCVARFLLLLALSLAPAQTTAQFAAAAAFLSTLLTLAYGPAVAKALPLLAAERLHKANALTGVAFLVASAVGPSLGGATLARYGLSAACGVFAAASLANLPLALAVSFHRAGQARPPRSFKSLVGSLSATPVVIAIFAVGVLLNFCLAPINVALAPLMLSFGAGPEECGYSMSLFVVGAVLGNAAVGSRYARAVEWDRSIYAALGAIALGLVAVGVSRSPAQAGAAMLLLGVFVPFFQVPMSTQLQRTISPEDAGQAFATLNAVTTAAAPLAAAGAGLLLQKLSPSTLFYCAGGASALLCMAWDAFRRQTPAAERTRPPFRAPRRDLPANFLRRD